MTHEADKVIVHDTFQKENAISVFYQNCVHLDKNTFIHCSRITEVHVYVNMFV